MKNIRYEKDGENIATLVLSPTHPLDRTFAEELNRTLVTLEKDQVAGVVLIPEKGTVSDGSDLRELLAYDPSQKEEAIEISFLLQQALRKLETLGKPVVAAINGPALGEGYEICLAAHRRIATEDPVIRIGLPQVGLGLMPGSGGVSRLVRLLGLEKALPCLQEGGLLGPKDAFKAGLIDEVAEDEKDLRKKARAWILGHPEARQPWDEKNFQIPGGTMLTNPRVAQFVSLAPARLKKKTRGLYPAEEKILSAAAEGMLVNVDAALRIEGRYMVELLATPVAKNLISFSLQTAAIKAGGSRPKGFEQQRVRKLGILGAGMMGAGIACVSAGKGIEVVLKDVELQKAEKGKSHSARLMDKQIARGRATEEQKEALLSRIHPTADASDLSGCDLIIEAVFEDVPLKNAVTREAEVHLAEGGIFASNTSTLPITGLAEASKNPANFIGLHFFSPVDRMPLVEIICGRRTSDETLARSFDFVQQIGKAPIVVNDSRGFYTSRVFGTFLDEGCALLEDGVDPLLIDNLSKLDGMPVGPLTIRDEVSQKLGVSVRKANIKMVEEEGGTWKEMASDRVLRVVTEEHGRLGKAYNGGFYDYPENGRKRVWPKLYELFYKPDAHIPRQDIQDRILFRQAIEAVKCLEEGVLRSVADCNIGSILGIGFPRYTGGQLQYINTYGVRRFVERANELTEKYGERFTPPQLLMQKAEKGELFV